MCVCVCMGVESRLAMDERLACKLSPRISLTSLSGVLERRYWAVRPFDLKSRRFISAARGALL